LYSTSHLADIISPPLADVELAVDDIRRKQVCVDDCVKPKARDLCHTLFIREFSSRNLVTENLVLWPVKQEELVSRGASMGDAQAEE
jgi:hypothetical protein